MWKYSEQIKDFIWSTNNDLGEYDENKIQFAWWFTFEKIARTVWHNGSFKICFQWWQQTLSASFLKWFFSQINWVRYKCWSMIELVFLKILMLIKLVAAMSVLFAAGNFLG